MKKEKIKITHKYKNTNGDEENRATSKDAETLPLRFFQRIEQNLREISNSDINDLLDFIEEGLTKYNQGEYEHVLECFSKIVDKYSSLISELKPFIEICKRVISTEKNQKDLLYEDYKRNMEKWHSKSFFFKFFHKKEKPSFPFQLGLLESSFKIRCKYCGHYTSYVDPNYGLEWVRKDTNPKQVGIFHNQCEYCGRSYPCPSAEWDNIDGQAYIYYRHSVPEKEFYDEFEKKYNISESEKFNYRKYEK